MWLCLVDGRRSHGQMWNWSHWEDEEEEEGDTVGDDNDNKKNWKRRICHTHQYINTGQ